MVEPIIRVKDIAWIRLWSPDLDVAEEYLRDFGLLRAERTANALYMRGTDPVHHIHITEKGDPKVERIAFWAKSEDDLHQLSRDAAELRRSRHSTSPAGRLNAEVVHVLQEPAIVERLRTIGTEPKPSTPEQLRARMAADIARPKWLAIVDSTNFERI
jgi:hypothetical protein